MSRWRESVCAITALRIPLFIKSHLPPLALPLANSVTQLEFYFTIEKENILCFQTAFALELEGISHQSLESECAHHLPISF